MGAACLRTCGQPAQRSVARVDAGHAAADYAAAQDAEDRSLIISRAHRADDGGVEWVASYLEDAALAQTACSTLVELAHHRELRHPNMEKFGPILDKVAATSKDPTVVERAKRYRLGL